MHKHLWSVLNLVEKTIKMLIKNLLIQVTDYSAEYETNNNVLGFLEGGINDICSGLKRFHWRREI